MEKFIINKVLVEKSEKDIKTGIVYNFSSGLNFICGNNEAGKSSLMNFLKTGFFLENKSDKGKIYVSISDNEYRRDIDFSKNRKERCKFYDNSGNIVPNFSDKYIDRRYYYSGFTLTLDELCTLNAADNLSLTDLINDTSSKKLNENIQNYIKILDIFISKDGKAKKNLSEIIKNLPEINEEIQNYSNNETEYNIALSNLHSAENNLQNLKKKLSFLKKSKDLNELEKEKSVLSVNFNPKLQQNREKYYEIIETYGKYKANLKIIEENTEKIENLKNRISQDTDIIKTKYSLNISKENIINFSFDLDKTNKISDLINEIKKSEMQIENYQNDINNYENKIKKNIGKSEQELNNQKLSDIKTFYDLLEFELKKYYFITTEETKGLKSAKYSKNLKQDSIVIGIISAITFLYAVIAFIKNNIMAGSFACCILIFSATYYLIKFSKRKKDLLEITEKETQQTEILNNLKKQAAIYYPNIINEDEKYISLKLEHIKDTLKRKIEKADELICEDNQHKQYITELQNKIDLLTSQKNNFKSQIDNLIEFNIDYKKYNEFIEFIKKIQKDLTDFEEISTVINSSKNINETIKLNLKNFIIENNINMEFSENITDNIEKLKKYNDINDNKSNDIKIRNEKISELKNQINELKITNIEIDFDNIDEIIKETEQAKNELSEEIKKINTQKYNLEHVKSVSGLKAQKTLLTDKYRAKVKELFTIKMILYLADKAKKNFDKNQPDLVNAQKYLNILTGGKYSLINLEKEEIENSTGSIIKNWNNLSRGTKEQLYLALRLGYASNYSVNSTTMQSNGKANLPLIIDDAFVNFDKERTKNTLKCLSEFSETNQVLFFTCHYEEMISLAKELNVKNNVVYL